MRISSKSLRGLIFSFDMFQKNQIVGILDSLDVFIKDVMSFREWTMAHETFDVIKIEGIESNNKIVSQLNIPSIKNIHLFIHNKTSYSFNWHKDDVTVLLYVVTGMKIVYIKNSRHTVKAGSFIKIPRRQIHKVFSKKGTVALSIGI